MSSLELDDEVESPFSPTTLDEEVGIDFEVLELSLKCPSTKEKGQLESSRR